MNKCSMQKKKESLAKQNEDRRRKDRYGHSVRRFTANDLSLTPDIKITKIIPPTMDDMEKCNMSRNGKLSVLFSVEGENFKLDYNPTISGYDGMRALAREHCSITNLDTGKVYDCTGAYSIPWLDNPEDKFIYHQRKEPVVQAYMNPTEQMVLAQFIKPFAKDYLGVDATESKRRSEKLACSMQKKKESLAKKSEGFMEDIPYDAPVAIDALCAEIMSHTEAFTIEDAAVAEMCGKWYIRNYADGPTAAHNEDEWVDEVLTGLSGSPVDGSPFGAAEAEEYAHKVFEEELAE